jgi:ERF superfamily
MTTSEQIHELAAALSKAQGEMEGATKGSSNPFFKSKYADLASVRAACQAPFAKHGLSVLQFLRTEYLGTPEIYEWTSRAGETRTGVKVITVVSVVTRLLHASGQWAEDVASAMLPSADPQAVGSATTYLRRYSLQSVAGIAPEDDDGEAAQLRSTGAAKPILVPAPPKGFNGWLADLEATADTGTVPLREAWKASPGAMRDYLTLTNKNAIDGLKARAETVDSLKKPAGVSA